MARKASAVFNRTPFLRTSSRARGSVVASAPALLAALGLSCWGSPLWAQSVDAEIEALEAESESASEEAASAPAEAAQEVEEAAPAPPAAEAPPTAVEPEAVPEGDFDEVVVTVDRRSKSLQDYSGVAEAFSEKQLQNLGITNVRELSSMVPGLQIGVQEGNAEVYIRGVGSDNNTELGDPAVALHLDGVYLPRPRGLGSMFFDIERVEVSSGPQGTLRGRNALGGSVNIISAQPKLGEWDASAQATFGTFAQRRYQGMLNVPLGDTLALRVAGFTEVHDSYWENAGPLHDITAAENADTYAYRATLKYEPSPAFTAVLAYDYTTERGTGYLGANFQTPLSLEDEDGNSTAIDPNSLDNPRRVYMIGMNPYLEMKHQGGRLVLDYDAGPVLFQALASYRYLDYQQVTGSNAGVIYPGYDFAGANADAFGSSYWHTTSSSMVAELRAYAPDDSRFRWTVGGFFFDETQDVVLGLTSDPANGFGGGEFNMPDVKGGSLAAYADATFDVSESFRVLAGVRFTTENKTRENGFWGLWNGLPGTGLGRFGTEGFNYQGLDRPTFTRDSDSVEDRVNLFLDGIESFGARDEVPQALCNDAPEGEDRIALVDGNWRCTAGVREDLPDNIFDFVPQNNDVSTTYFDWRAGVEFDFSKDNLLYATVTTGHKAAGFNDTVNVGLENLFNSEYGSESIISFELGTKNVLMDRKLRLNASAFAYAYSDLVFQTIVQVQPDPDLDDDTTPPSSAVRQNADAVATVLGLDIDAAYSLPAGIQARLHALLMDAKFGDGTDVQDARIGFGPDDNYVVDVGGNWLPRASALTLNFSLSQLLFTEVGSFNWMVQGQTRTEHFMTVFNGDGETVLDPADGVEFPTSDAFNRIQENPSRLNDVVPTYTRFDLSAGWTHPDGRLAVSGYVNNLTNIAYATSIISNPGTNLRFFNPPRTAGVRMRVDW